MGEARPGGIEGTDNGWCGVDVRAAADGGTVGVVADSVAGAGRAGVIEGPVDIGLWNISWRG